MNENHQLEVVVHYVAAEKPFKHHENRHETVGQFKPVVLKAFSLTEGQGKVYVLYHDKKALENPHQTLGELAGDKHTLQLKLIEQVIQG